ncbi:MAG: hypothetical protein QMC40_01970 [Vicingaceae bacterium]|jgi:hypothetical protein|tara:strand:+ start:616 stop:1329 length:714 start_codon:yes stop_codon:yes gene_type:complete
MNQKIIIAFLSLFFIGYSFGQVNEKDPYGRDLEALTINKRGPNQDKYSHLFLSYAFITGLDNDSSEIIFGKSGAFSIGYLWKWRLAKWSELGFDVAYHRSAFHLKQDSSKIIPNSIIYKREKLVFNSIVVSPFIRIKLVNRLHSNGIFIDLGGYAGWQYDVRHKSVEKRPNPGANQTKTLDTRLDYIRDYNYGLLARIGFNRFVFYGRYRMTNLFTDRSGFRNLPQYEFGMRIGIHQ